LGLRQSPKAPSQQEAIEIEGFDDFQGFCQFCIFHRELLGKSATTCSYRYRSIRFLNNTGNTDQKNNFSVPIYTKKTWVHGEDC